MWFGPQVRGTGGERQRNGSEWIGWNLETPVREKNSHGTDARTPGRGGCCRMTVSPWRSTRPGRCGRAPAVPELRGSRRWISKAADDNVSHHDRPCGTLRPEAHAGPAPRHHHVPESNLGRLSGIRDQALRERGTVPGEARLFSGRWRIRRRRADRRHFCRGIVRARGGKGAELQAPSTGSAAPVHSSLTALSRSLRGTRGILAWLTWVLVVPVSASASANPVLPAAPAPQEASAQAVPVPRAVARATSLLEAGDTAAALGLLRTARDEDDRDPQIAFALGTLLARTAPLEETDFRQRMEAEALLEEAYEGLHEDAGVLLEMALLKRRQFMRVDSRRILERTVASEGSRAVEPRVLAQSHFVLARILTEEMEDFEHLVFLPAGWRRDGSPGTDEYAGSTRCPAGVQAFCLNYTEPRTFNAQLARAGRASDRDVDYPPRIEAHYRAALSYVPDHPQAARGLLALLHRQGRFEDMATEAQRLAEVNPDDTYAHIFLGLAFYESLDWTAARNAFDTGLALMPPAERAPYDNVAYLLNEEDAAEYQRLEPGNAREYERILWAKSDPLFLIPENERAMEHIARVTYAELAFGDPERRLPGWSSDRGEVFIRYGMPPNIWMLRQDGAGPNPAGSTRRWIFWNYRPEVPSFVFNRQVGYNRVDFDFSANTQMYLRQVSETEATTTFESRAVNRWTEIPAQIARFKGAAPGQVEVLAFLRADPDSFNLFEGDSVRVGMFLFNRSY
ncbi:MAG: GWxTD domain-containing protein, partial [Gemmatimonadetes bacterium]|nr:GWxTD domain-containing protein [Gemmatimonadota bacterium]